MLWAVLRLLCLFVSWGFLCCCCCLFVFWWSFPSPLCLLQTPPPVVVVVVCLFLVEFPFSAMSSPNSSSCCCCCCLFVFGGVSLHRYVFSKLLLLLLLLLFVCFWWSFLSPLCLLQTPPPVVVVVVCLFLVEFPFTAMSSPNSSSCCSEQYHDKRRHARSLIGGSNLRLCIRQDSEPNTLPTELFRPMSIPHELLCPCYTLYMPDLGLHSHAKEFWGNGVRTHVNSKEKSPLPEKILVRGGSNPRRFIKQNSDLNTLPTSYSGPHLGALRGGGRGGGGGMTLSYHVRGSYNPLSRKFEEQLLFVVC